MNNLIKEFVDAISAKDELQGKYVKSWQATDSEKEELKIILQFFMTECHHDMEFIVDAYLFINNMVREETHYFIRHGRYRYATFSEVNKLVYDNPRYMEKYMMGLVISDYIWINHIKMLRFFENNSHMFAGKGYLEIGPGYGCYLVRALKNCNFSEYYACDISKTSVDGCNSYLKYRGLSDRCMVIKKDFFQYCSDRKFDCIVMGEVLEHVEKPDLMLEKMHELLSEEGKAFVSTVINAPTLDHIFLFRSVEQVLDMIKNAGFDVVDYMCSTEGDIPMEKAVKRRQAINIAIIMKKR